MPVFAVRHRFNYNVVQIEADGGFIGKSLTGSSLPVLTKSSGRKFYNFSGSIDIEDRYGHQLVKVLDIAAYTLDPSNVLRRRWIDVPGQHYCAAALFGNSIKCLLDGNQ